MKSSGNVTHANRAGATSTVPASEVKNAWHEYVDRVSQAREEIVVTRYGKPVMKLVPVNEEDSAGSLIGHLAGAVTLLGDLVAPLGGVWDAEG